MNKNLAYSSLIVLFGSSSVLAHAGHQHQPLSRISFFADNKSATDKYEFNDGDNHLGHFFIKKNKVGKKSERLILEQTFHRENSNVTKRTKAHFDTSNNVLSFQFTLDDENLKYHIFAHIEDLEGGDNDVQRVIVNTENGSLAADSFTLNLVDSSNEGGESEDSHEHGNGHHHN